jgi:hypothetical protein
MPRVVSVVQTAPSSRRVGMPFACTTAWARPVSLSASAIATDSKATPTLPIAAGPSKRPMARNFTAARPRTTTCWINTQVAALPLKAGLIETSGTLIDLTDALPC